MWSERRVLLRRAVRDVRWLGAFASLLAVGVPAASQRPGPVEGDRSVPARPVLPPGRSALQDPDVVRARALVMLFLRTGTRQPYVGEQVTRLRDGRRESRQFVKHEGPGRERVEYLSPPSMRGEILLLTGGRLFRYVPGRNRVMEGVAPSEELLRNLRRLTEYVRKGRVTVREVGSQVVAGRPAGIVEIRPSRPDARYRRIWIDERTGVRLKTEEVGPQGLVASTTYFASIDYSPSFGPGDFRPDSLPSVPHVPLFPASRSLGSVQAAQAQVGYTIREPALPPGYQLSGVWVAGGAPGRATVVLRYSDGVNTFAILERPALVPVARPAARTGKVRNRNGVARWAADGKAFTLIGNLKPESTDLIVDSLQ